jgi:hypothetical protein
MRRTFLCFGTRKDSECKPRCHTVISPDLEKSCLFSSHFYPVLHTMASFAGTVHTIDTIIESLLESLLEESA